MECTLSRVWAGSLLGLVFGPCPGYGTSPWEGVNGCHNMGGEWLNETLHCPC